MASCKQCSKEFVTENPGIAEMWLEMTKMKKASGGEF
jgi:hypothetical protein